MNLLTDRWLPVIRKNGQKIHITPYEITSQPENPIVQLNLPRPDFNGAIYQFLIGLFQTCFIQTDEIEWDRRYNSPPDPKELKTAYIPYLSAFEVDSGEFRFMQDMALEDNLKESKPIGSLFIDEPGENTLKENKDFFFKRGQNKALSLVYAAISLFTLQLNAPSGGAGHRTSLRGGGPLTTLLIPKDKTTLWHQIWINCLSQETAQDLYDTSKYKNNDAVPIEDIFPWMAPTKTSEKKQIVLPQDTHWTQLFWATPRRIKLKTDHLREGTCSITSKQLDAVIEKYTTKNYGANYENWRHPLSPYYKSKNDMLPIHPNSSGMTYKHWLGWTLGNGKDSECALVVKIASNLYRRKYSCRLWAFGYDMDNMKARGWQESKMPIFYFENDTTENYFKDIVSQILTATKDMITNLTREIKKAWHFEKGDISYIEMDFWNTTELDFYKLLRPIRRRIHKDLEDEMSDLRKEWHAIINKKCLELFDFWVMSTDVTAEETQRIVKARKNLKQFNYSKSIKQNLHLQTKKEVSL